MKIQERGDRSTIETAAASSPQLDWERQFTDKFLAILATPDYSCSPAGSYSVEPLIRFIKQRDQHLKEEIEKLYVYDVGLGVNLISKGAVLKLLKKI